MRRNALAPLLALLCVALGPLRCSASEQASGSFLPLYHTNNDPLAVCNDGSPAGFYFSPANDTSKSNLWLVYLEGGQWCYDADSCAQRQVLFPYLTSSWPWYHHLRMGGIFDADPRRSPWAGANLVFIGYCSSDAWVGDVGPESNSWGWSFRGQRIIASVFAALSYGVDVTTTETVHFPNKTHAKVTDTVTYKLGTAPKVLFAGCSAGSRGAMFNLDYVQDMLPPGAPPVLGFFDSPMWVDVQPFEPGTMPLENETMAVYNLVNATARIPPACAAAYPGAEGWKCLYGQYRIPFVQTPYLMSASQFDKYQLPYNEGSMPPWNASALAYATEFQAAVRDVMLNLPTKAQPRSAIYSSACFKHCTSTLAWGSFWGVKIDNLSLKDYLGMWYFGSSDPDQQNDDTGQQGSMPPSMSPQRIEACNGFGCGQCHKKLVAPAPPLPPTYAMSLVPGQTATRHRHLPSARHEKRSGLPHVIALVMLCAVGVGALAAARRQMAGPARARSAAGAVKEVPLGEASPLLRKPPAASTAAAPAFETKYAALGEAAAKQLAAAKPQAAKPKAAPPPAEPAAAASKAAPAVAAPKAAPAAAAPAPAPAAAAQAAAAAAAGAAEAKAAAAKRAVDEAAANTAAEEAAAARKAAEVAAQKAAADAAANKAAAEAAANKAAAEAATQQAAVAAAAAQSAATEAAAQKAGAEEVVQQAASQAAAKKAAEEAAAAQQIAAAAAAAQQAVEAAAAETPAEAAGESDDEIDRALARAVAEEAASLLHEVDTGTSAGSTAETAETPAAAAAAGP